MGEPSHPLFSAGDLEAIRDAAARAERRTSGEIVSYCVERCDEYPEAAARGVAWGALAAAAAAAVWHTLAGLWGAGFLWILLPPALGGVLGWGLARIPTLRRRLIAGADLERRILLRAESAFLEEEVFRTRDRTGVLLFLALFEHRVVVLADAGIHRQVEASEWEGISDRLARGIKEGRAAAALIAAIGECGELLERCRLEPRADDADELANELRIRDE